VENRESQNSHVVDKIPLTLGFNSQLQMLKVEDLESPNSCMAIEVGLDEIPSTLSFDFVMVRSPIAKVSPFHVIFNLNGVLIPTRFNKCSRIIIFHLGLKEFLEKCLGQFQVYIWFTT
jgi:hypothetical protein